MHKSFKIRPDEEHKHGRDGDVAHQREEMVLQHLEEEPYEGGAGDDSCR